MDMKANRRMSIELKRHYLMQVVDCYPKSNRKEKAEIINQFSLVTGMHRKAVIRLIRQSVLARQGKAPCLRLMKRRGRKPQFHEDELVKHLRKLWINCNQLCSKRMRASFEDWFKWYDCPDNVKEKLLIISPSTIDRILKPYRAQYRRRKRSGTKPGTLLKTLIPIKLLDRSIERPGFIQADTVAHCGGSLLGTHIWSLTFTDEFTGWTEIRGIWGKGSLGVLDAIKDIEVDLPFEMVAFNSDNGSEFLNDHLYRYFADKTQKKMGFKLSRSRPNKKNDNAKVEQKNWTHVRQLFGYERFDRAMLVPLMNDVYRDFCRLQNYYMPQMKLVRKERVGSKIKRKYDTPQTPFKRLMESGYLTEEMKVKIQKIKDETNPFHLSKQIEEKLEFFYKILKKDAEEESA